MKISLIITTKNEYRTISKLLLSIAKQTRIPDEVIITNAGSDRLTRQELFAFTDKLHIIYTETDANANRAVGRNLAISLAAHDHIFITDAGCTLDPHWVQRMEKGFIQSEVVAGFYASNAQSTFEKCVTPYVLIMPDQLDKRTFLPATRSMGVTKKIWKELGSFDEKYRYNEDYVFSRKLSAAKIPIHVVDDAIVYWTPRASFGEFLKMIYMFALGDAQSGMWRPKVGFIFTRYALGLLLVSIASVFHFYIYILLLGLSIYSLYAVKKNYRYVRHPLAFVYLPLLQYGSDFAVICGTVYGYLHTPQDRPLTQ